jgi:putative inorganic carbon (HCO3(-)) transporter
MRDLILFGTVGVLVPMIIVHPYIGALLWVVFGLMNPHRLAFGPAHDFPFAFLIGSLTLFGILITRDPREMKFGPPGFVLALFIVWINITTIFALTPELAVPMWSRVMKILLMTYVLMLLLHTRRQIDLLLGAIVCSVGFYGVKGGIFTILTGGGNMVYGPDDSVLSNNNHLGVANVVIIPLFWHFYQQSKNPWIRWGSLAAMLLCAAAALGSYSRGAVLALAAMGLILWARSAHKVRVMALIAATILILIPVMPERWDARMHSIETYQEDGSAMSRINSWATAWNIANDRVLGAGFEYPSPSVIAKYSPIAIDPEGPNAQPVAHSIYFQVIGEHGFIGFGLWLLFWVLVLRECESIRRMTRERADLKWAFSLISMVEASLVGYAVGGAFINIAFWDMPYYLYALVMLTKYVVTREVSARESADTSLQMPRGPRTVEGDRAATPVTSG